VSALAGSPRAVEDSPRSPTIRSLGGEDDKAPWVRGAADHPICRDENVSATLSYVGDRYAVREVDEKSTQ